MPSRRHGKSAHLALFRGRESDYFRFFAAFFAVFRFVVFFAAFFMVFFAAFFAFFATFFFAILGLMDLFT
jgi:hypothetical protein